MQCFFEIIEIKHQRHKVALVFDFIVFWSVIDFFSLSMF